VEKLPGTSSKAKFLFLHEAEGLGGDFAMWATVWGWFESGDIA
jgi:hypothetical protein